MGLGGRKGDSDNASGTSAVIEMANASGLKLLAANELDPLHATSYGTGELIKAALEKNVNRITKKLFVKMVSINYW